MTGTRNANNNSGRDQGEPRKEEAQDVTDVTLGGSAGNSTGLEPQAQDRISRKLKAMYDDVVNEPVPDHLMKLLKELDDRK